MADRADGEATLRDDENEEYELKQWDTVVFLEGPEGAHKVTNRTDEPVRIAIFSTKNDPAIFDLSRQRQDRLHS